MDDSSLASSPGVGPGPGPAVGPRGFSSSLERCLDALSRIGATSDIAHSMFRGRRRYPIGDVRELQRGAGAGSQYFVGVLAAIKTVGCVLSAGAWIGGGWRIEDASWGLATAISAGHPGLGGAEYDGEQSTRSDEGPCIAGMRHVLAASRSRCLLHVGSAPAPQTEPTPRAGCALGAAAPWTYEHDLTAASRRRDSRSLFPRYGNDLLNGAINHCALGNQTNRNLRFISGILGHN